MVLLSAVRVSSRRSQKRGGPATESPLEVPPVQMRLLAVSPRIIEEDSADRGSKLERGEKCKKFWFLCGKKRMRDFSLKKLLNQTSNVVLI